MPKITISVVTTTSTFVTTATSVPVTTPWTPPTSLCTRVRISPDLVLVKKRSDCAQQPLVHLVADVEHDGLADPHRKLVLQHADQPADRGKRDHEPGIAQQGGRSRCGMSTVDHAPHEKRRHQPEDRGDEDAERDPRRIPEIRPEIACGPANHATATAWPARLPPP